jgi:hypothetical protein
MNVDAERRRVCGGAFSLNSSMLIRPWQPNATDSGQKRQRSPFPRPIRDSVLTMTTRSIEDTPDAGAIQKGLDESFSAIAANWIVLQLQVLPG